MPKLHTSFVKITASPSPSAWAQVYHAGNVYAVVSVQQTAIKEKDPEHALPSVHVLGKEIINNIEAEYFTIVEKNLQTIKEALATACTTIPDDVAVSILVGVVIEKILYVFLYGKGEVFLQREEKAGNILKHPESKQVTAASGIIEPNDTVILATPQFIKAIPFTQLKDSLHVSSTELEEKFAPIIDNDDHAGAAAAIIYFNYPQEKIEEPKVPNEPKGNIESHPSKEHLAPVAPLTPLEPKEEPLSLKDTHHLEDEFEDERVDSAEVLHEEKPQKKFSIKRFLFLVIAFVLAGILIFNIVKAVHKQTQHQSEILFSSQFPAAQQKYDEGKNLLSLNKNLAQDDFQKAKTTLEDLKTKLPANSPHLTQINDLLAKVNQALGSGNNQQTTLTPADSKVLKPEIDNHEVWYATQDDTNMYYMDGTTIYTINKNSDKESTLIRDKTSSNIGGFGTYVGNFYVLDKKENQIFKFTKSDNGYDKTNYLKDRVDVNHVISMTIDGSIWILSDDGSIKKFTKGTQDQFSMEQLQKPLTHPTRIFTTSDIDNLYILDPQNTRILAIKKNGGNLVQEYDAKELKDAKDIDVDEKNKKMYVLIGDKIYSMDLK